MKRKSAGADRWCAQALLLLPNPAWQRLLGVLTLVETSHRWPSSLTHWRICFLPKQNSGEAPTDATKVRPIAVGPLLFRDLTRKPF